VSQPSSQHSVLSVRPPRVRRAGDAVVVSLVGEVGSGAADALLCRLAADLEWRPTVVVVDLTQARLGPGSRAALRRMHGQVTAAGARFGVATPAKLARQLLADLTLDPEPLVYPGLAPAPPWSGSGQVRLE
jgi:hypothetical protein